MTRKDYVVIAAGLARTRPDVEDYTHHSAIGNNTMVNGIAHGAAVRQWSVTRDAIIGALQADNPRFDRARFVRATEA